MIIYYTSTYKKGYFSESSNQFCYKPVLCFSVCASINAIIPTLLWNYLYSANTKSVEQIKSLKWIFPSNVNAFKASGFLKGRLKYKIQIADVRTYISGEKLTLTCGKLLCDRLQQLLVKACPSVSSESAQLRRYFNCCSVLFHSNGSLIKMFKLDSLSQIGIKSWSTPDTRIRWGCTGDLLLFLTRYRPNR